MTSYQVTALAQQAADLLPEPPAVHDSFGYLAWEELVLTTARRLLWTADGALPHPVNAQSLSVDSDTGRLTGSALLALAALTADPASSAGELALAEALSGRSDHATARREPVQRRCEHTTSRRRTGHGLSSRVQPLAAQLRA